MRLIKILATWLFVLTLTRTYAGEGMWLPLLLKQLNEAEMQAMGMKMSAEDIYSVNKGSLKDAVVLFGGGCTAEVISGQGLLLTNHHCGYGQIQAHSSVEKNYIDNGFWAKTIQEELPNPGLSVTFIVRIEDVTTAALAGVLPDMSDKERQSQIDKNLNGIRQGTTKETYQDVIVRPFFKGNQYFMFVTETYRDIRLVGAPPSSIGKFGADTDNWVWPRHTGDFSIFRIYASKDNKPSDYSADNVPYQPKHYFPISLDGVAEGDFTMVFGFPGRTDEYLPAVAVDVTANVLNPIRIGMRDKSLAIIDQAMRNDVKTKIQYASKQSRIANSWKKWLGETQGIRSTGGVERKKKLEAEFTTRINANPELKLKYGTLLADFDKLWKEITPYAQTRDYVSELANTNIEMFQVVNTLSRYVTMFDNGGLPAVQGRWDQLKKYFEGHFKNYNADVDQRIFAALMEVYFNNVNKDHLSPYAVEQVVSAGKDYDAFARVVYGKSFLDNEQEVMTALGDPASFIQRVKQDMAYVLARDIVTVNEQKVLNTYNPLRSQLDLLERKYMSALMEVFPERRFYPDANSTLRVTYGKVNGYAPRDAVKYEPMTYLSGVMEKYVPGDYEFDVPERLRELYDKKDYGQYGQDGQMPVCFIGSNHTTGGNSGSPAIDAYGNLVGLNFDRTWEGTMSDLNYDASICRNIMVDIRYVLFIVDKFAGATNLIEELKLVHPKKDASQEKPKSGTGQGSGKKKNKSKNN